MTRKFIKIGRDIISIDQIVAIEPWATYDRAKIYLISNQTIVVDGDIRRTIDLLAKIGDVEIYEAI